MEKKFFIIHFSFLIFFMDYSKAKELMKLQQDMQKIKKELSNTHIEAEVDGVVITVDAEMKVVKTQITDSSILQDQKKLENAFTEAANKGMKKAQEIAAQKMQGVAKGMGLDLPGGLPGM